MIENPQERKDLSKELILESLVQYGCLFGKCPSEKALKLYAEMLCGQFEFKQVTWALSEFVKNGSAFFPSCGEIFALLNVDGPKKEDAAPIIANEIIRAIREYGQYDEVRMYESLSEDAKTTLIAMSGSSHIRNAPEDQIGTTRAQIERLARSILLSRANKARSEELLRIGIGSADFKAINRETTVLQ